MRALATLFLLTAASSSAAAVDLAEPTRVLELFSDLPQEFVVVGAEEEDNARSWELRSADPAGRSSMGPIYLRASLKVSQWPDAAAAAGEVERLLTTADPDMGLSYAWDAVVAHQASVVHLWAACTLPEVSFETVEEALTTELRAGGTEPGPSFRCRCGARCRASEPPVETSPRRVPPVRRSPAIEDEGEEWDNRLDPSGSWQGSTGELSLMHYANRLAFSYLAVFGPTAHICEGAGVAGLVGTDTYEWGDDQGTIAFVIDEQRLSMSLVDGVASFCGAGWSGESFDVSGLELPVDCAVVSGRTHFQVVDHLGPEPQPAYVSRGDTVQTAAAHHAPGEGWVLARWVGPVMTTMGLLPQADLDCPEGLPYER
jgi:hypothetical protein